MFKQDFSIHTHTSFSDGCNSPEEMIIAAQNTGFKTLGISDHFYAIEHDLPKYIKNIRSAQAKYGINVLVGAEIDRPTPSMLEKLYKIKRTYGFDYFIAALHTVPFQGAEYYVGNNQFTNIIQCDEYQKQYWTLLSELSSDVFDIIAHLDLIKISGVKTEHRFTEEIKRALSLFKKNNQIVEINTKFSLTENQPSDTILAQIAKLGIPIIFSSDAHINNKIGYRFNEEIIRTTQSVPLLKHINTTETFIKFLNQRKNLCSR